MPGLPKVSPFHRNLSQRLESKMRYKTTQIRVRLAACAAIAVLLSLAALGCGASDDPTTVQADPGVDLGADTTETSAVHAEDPAESSTTTTTSPADETDAEDPDQPETLAGYLGVPWLSFDLSDQQDMYRRQEQQAQELIAACMAQEGFEYIPAVRPDLDEGFGNPWDVEYAREYGFGISTTFGETFALDDSDWVDPNQAIIEALSESERNAYFEILYGFSDAAAPLDPESPADSDGSSGIATESEGEGTAEAEPSVDAYEDLFGQSCSGQAYEQVYAIGRFEEIYEQLDLESMFERMEADPRVKDFGDDWADCMRERGYEYDEPDALYDSVYIEFGDRLKEITGSSGGLFGDFEDMSAEEYEELFADKSPEEIEDYYGKAEQEAVADIDQEALGELQEQERELAVDNAECSDGLLELYAKIGREYEARFIEENRAVLEQFRADG